MAEYILEHDASRADAPGPRPRLRTRGRGRPGPHARGTAWRRTDGVREALAGWPDAWEAIVAHAWLMGAKRGPGDAGSRSSTISPRCVRTPEAPPLRSSISSSSRRAAAAPLDRARAVDARAHAAGGLDATALTWRPRASPSRAPGGLRDLRLRAHPGEPHPRGSLTCYHVAATPREILRSRRSRTRAAALAPGRRRPPPPADAPRRARNRGPGRRRPRRPRHAAGRGDAVEPLRSRDARPDARHAVARHARAALPRDPQRARRPSPSPPCGGRCARTRRRASPASPRAS